MTYGYIYVAQIALVTNYKLSEETRKRIDIMCDTNDGFRIAEADLKLKTNALFYCFLPF